MKNSTICGGLCCVSFALAGLARLAFGQVDVRSESDANRPAIRQMVPTKREIIQKRSLLVVTNPEWCKPCERLEPVLERLRKEGYLIETIGIEDYVSHEGLPEVQSVPTLIFHLHGKSVKVWAGYHSYRTIKAQL